MRQCNVFIPALYKPHTLTLHVKKPFQTKPVNEKDACLTCLWPYVYESVPNPQHWLVEIKVVSNSVFHKARERARELARTPSLFTSQTSTGLHLVVVLCSCALQLALLVVTSSISRRVIGWKLCRHNPRLLSSWGKVSCQFAFFTA